MVVVEKRRNDFDHRVGGHRRGGLTGLDFNRCHNRRDGFVATAFVGAHVGDRPGLFVPAQLSIGHGGGNIHSLGADETGSAGGALIRVRQRRLFSAI